MAEEPIPPHPRNAPDDFYVENDCCIACTAPEYEAPDLMAHEDGQGGYHCYFKRQPEAPDEVERAISACHVSCVVAVRYAGRNPKILQRFKELGIEKSCDVLATVKAAGERPLTLQEKLDRLRRAGAEQQSSPTARDDLPLYDQGIDG